MSTPAAAPDHQKKKHRGARRRNAAASNPPKVETQSTNPPQTGRASQASNLLAQLAAAQGSTIPVSQPSTSRVPSIPKAKEINNKHQKQPRCYNRGKSVGARMSAKHPPPPAPSSQRNRTTSQGTYKQSDTTTYRGPKVPEDVLDIISFRFLMNVPDSERLDETRICFQIELAHWFYIDFYVNQDERADCVNIGMRDFVKVMFAHNDFLKQLTYRSDEILDNWRSYKSTVPTYGGILMDSSLNHILLVQGFYASKNSWGFPKGKVNQMEIPRMCAIREVLEETGFDFGEHSDGNEFKIQKMVNDTMIRLYIVKDVPMDYKFEPQTRCEIRKMKWFNIWDLPLDRNDQVAASNGFHPKNFYGVVPFVQDIQNYVKREEKKREKEGKNKKGVPLNDGKKHSAFTKVEKKSPTDRLWMGDVSMGSNSETIHFEGVETPTTYETLFKPLGETGGAPPGSNLAMILAHSSAGSTPRNASTSKASVAHPVAIRPCDHPVYEAPVKEDKCKVASNLIANVWSPAPTSSSHSATHIENTLNKLLFNAPIECVSLGMDRSKTPIQRDSSVDGDEEVKECVPTLSQEPSLPPLGDLCISVEGVYPTGLVDLPSTSSQTHSHSSSTFRRHSVSSSILSPAIKNRCAFELVPAWKSFKLNREQIFKEIASFFM
ncbi:dcap-2 [Pristionchus pacificus]|uniref:m7GpppN-mRNA hydrolase n=1 Tax=Pristionchus pacificus TaxID=54126 RepID=A0A2A6CAM6_PRIPA|nr:dcap-2 [Pristionchus pacificus]|eukprot:PDM75234.1 dcap-2 [Pristionchus pacificus]